MPSPGPASWSRSPTRIWGFSYRKSEAPADLIFVSALFEGIPTPKDEIEEAMAAVQKHREDNQPIKERTSGSTFKNPPGGSAWKVIDEAGTARLSGGWRADVAHALQLHDQHRRGHGLRP